MRYKYLNAAGRLLGHALRVGAIAAIVMFGIPSLYESAAVQLRLDANIYDFMNTFFLVYIIYFLHTTKQERSHQCYFEIDDHQDSDLRGVDGFDEDEPAQ